MKIDLTGVQDDCIVEVHNMEKIFDIKYREYLLNFIFHVNKEIITKEFNVDTTVLYVNEIIQKSFGFEISNNTSIEVRPFQVVNMSEIIAILIDGDKKYVFVTENIDGNRSIGLIVELFNICCESKIPNQHDPYSWMELNMELTERVYKHLNKDGE
jgi:hypothetical protein